MEGELGHENRAALLNWIDSVVAVESPLCLELSGLDIADAEGAAVMVEVIRRLLLLSPSLTLTHAPQLLAHLLYRTAMLEAGGRLRLVEPRQEEPYG